ncbi:uroporphyrinogen-III C-methyltransferase [Thiothrix nivea]|uniref:HemX domain protein n=1 Tax=Thiothrix nivea (strain ATCC 35100 / DSM 5205 / JP2) TaxID=870187 RepID=A0A656HEU5_THINJ|nr:uroporphyrinogen-III C-methyltransferase [Thiothrix nivea]EIJ34937.1 hemX domain protein [Thiothrix nivea DSM 5205]
MIDKPATHEAEDAPAFDTAVDAVDSLDNDSDREERPKAAGARFALFLAGLALLFTLIGIAAGYKHWQRMNDKARTNAAEIAELRQQLEAAPATDSLDKLRKELADKTAQLGSDNTQATQEVARMLNQTRQFADTVASQVEQVTFLQSKAQQNAAPATAEEWQVAEVEFLLQLANRALHLGQDTRTAISALKEADSLLAKIGSVAYLPVRQQVSRDISALEATPTPDIAGLSQRINALMLELNPLPALDTVADDGKREPLVGDADTAVTGNSLWADYKRKFAAGLNDAIIIRQHDKPIQMELDAEARQNLFQLLHLRLENLRLLALQRDNAGFHAQLELIRESINAYYPQGQQQPLLKALEDFARQDLQPKLPDISGSLKQLESARHTESVRQHEQPAQPTDDKVEATTDGKTEGGKHK